MTYHKALKPNGVTLVALVITIIVLIIIAGVTLTLVLNDNGIIGRATESRFKQNFAEVVEKVSLYWSDKEIEAIVNNTNPTAIEKLPVSTEATASSFSSSLKSEIEDISGKDLDDVILYTIDKSLIDYSSSHTYIIDVDTLQIYDVEGEKFRGKYHHTLYGLGYESDSEETQVIDTPVAQIAAEANYDGDIGWLKPDLSGFNKHFTFLVYYNEDDMDDTKEVPVEEYISNGRQSKIEENGKTYKLDWYTDKMWANVKTTSNGVTAWWIWIPRYAYKINGASSDPKVDIVFLDTDNTPLLQGDTADSFNIDNYKIHPGFTEKWTETQDEETVTKTKELQGIWLSKFEPSTLPNSSHNLDSGGCFPPDMEGFDPNNTYIEFYDIETDEFIDEKKLADVDLKTINQNNEWYDYSKKAWANIKTIANGIECWWVWIPRYAYSMELGEGETEVIFIDLNNKPYDKAKYGATLPSNLRVHPGFNITENGTAKQLKGIWLSKYEPSNKLSSGTTPTSGDCLLPDLDGFDPNNTYIEIYDSVTDEFIDEIKVADADLSTINKDNTWYDYKNKIWANIKTIANGVECWWVWMPRYAYNISSGGEVDIVFIDTNNIPVDTTGYGSSFPTGMKVHPGFTITDEDGNTKELKGIWLSKYEPSWVN